MRHTLIRSATSVLFFGLCFILIAFVSAPTQAQQAPSFKYDPSWPKLPLPNKWTFGGVTGMTVDSEDLIWVLHRPNDLADGENFATLNPPTAECCVKAPAVLAFDTQGNLKYSWDTQQGHLIMVDRKGQVWVGSDTLRIFTKEGKAVAEFPRTPQAPGRGRPGGAGREGGGPPPPPPYSPEIELIAGGVDGGVFDEQAREVFIVDSYLTGARVMVFDMDSFTFKRGWGAYGKPLKEIGPMSTRPEYDPAVPVSTYKDFVGHVTLTIAGGDVYAADRYANRVQVFTKQGKFVREFQVAPQTRGRGAAGGLVPSSDRQQRYLYVSDTMNNVVWIVNRQDGKTLGRFGFLGRSGGGFFWLHVVGTDSRGNLYTGEADRGNRVQKFVPVNNER